MKLSTQYQYDVLCEDRQTEVFIRGILQSQRINAHKIRIINAESGEGSAEAFVRLEYPKRIRALRQYSYNRRALIVCIDADNKVTSERKQQLSDACQKQNPAIKERQEREPVMIWIPKRNIETWIRFFAQGGENIDEMMDYGHNDSVRCRKEALNMSEYLQENVSFTNELSSLSEARDEYRRLCEIQSKRV